MTENELIIGITLLSTLTVGGLGLAFSRWTNRAWLGWIIAGMLAASTVVGLAFHVPLLAALPGLLLSGVWCLAEFGIHKNVWQVISNRKLQAGAFLVAGPGLAWAWLVFSEPAADSLTPSAANTGPVSSQAAPEPSPTSSFARTDLGRAIPLFGRPSEDGGADQAYFNENYLANMRPLTMIRTALADSGSNCHGWVFASGQFWVRSDAVESILNDNAYEVVAKPKTGDVVIYRSDSGQVVHSGLVRIAADGLVVVESKWGVLGRYLHAPGEQPYGGRWEFYHSSRRGHLLHIGDSEVPLEEITEE